MRRALPPALAALLAAALAGQTAFAQEKPGWIDPPAKPAGQYAGEPAEPPQAAQPARAPQPAHAARPAKDARPGSESEEKASAEVSRQHAAAPRREARTPSRRERAQARRQWHREAAVTNRWGPDRGGRTAEADEARASRRVPRRAAPPPVPSLARGPAPETGSSDPRLAASAGAAQRLFANYLDAVSGGDMAGTAPRFYSERVRFHGRSLSLPTLMAEKRRFARCWPGRRCETGDMRTACSVEQESCIVTTHVAYEAESAARDKRSAGTTELTLTVSFANGRPVIVSESSRVLRRGSVFGALPDRDRGA